MRALTFCLLLSAQILGAQSVATGQYNGGNAFYREGDFEAARRSYLEAVATGIEDARLYYNLGNACFKLSRLGEAVLWYERARRLAPHDEDVEANLHFANLVKKDREIQGEEGSLVEFVVAVYFWPSYDRLSLFFACGFFAVFVLALMRLLSRSKFGTGWLVAILLCSGLSLSAAVWFGTRLYARSGTDEAIVMVDEVFARYGPDEGQTEVFVVHEGTKVRLERQEEAWVLVWLANGLGGWVLAESIERI